MSERSLPGPTIDLIRDGVRPATRRNVQQALFATAFTAQTRGWGVVEWEALVLEGRNQLAWQTRNPVDGRRSLTDADVQKRLASAWDKAWERRSEHPAWTEQETIDEVDRRAAHVEGIAADNPDLRDSDRAVLGLVVALARERSSTRVTLARRRIVEATGLGERTTRNAVQRLLDAGLLVLVEKGKPRGARATKPARAAIYGLPAPGVPKYLPGTPASGTPSTSSGTPTVQAHGTPSRSSGTPTPPTTPETGPEMIATGPSKVTLTVSADDPEDIARAIDALLNLRASAASAEGSADPAPLPGNVLTLRQSVPVRRDEAG